jgi:hypothetical protein
LVRFALDVLEPHRIGPSPHGVNQSIGAFLAGLEQKIVDISDDLIERPDLPDRSGARL